MSKLSKMLVLLVMYAVMVNNVLASAQGGG